jgi:hypothetical protein
MRFLRAALASAKIKQTGAKAPSANPGTARRNGQIVRPLPAEQAAPLWQTAQAQAMKASEGPNFSRISTSAILFVRSYRKSCKADNRRDQHRQNVGQHWVTP